MLRIHRVSKDPSILPENFWDSQDSELMIDERWAQGHEKEIEFLAEHLPLSKAVVWIASSGTMTAESKWIGISKDAMLKNAKSVIDHLNISPQDRWALSLPLSHVGGLSIHARSFLIKQTIETNQQSDSYQWVSLVPTQVYDIVQNKSNPSPKLKGALVGGDALAKDLYKKALELGWPLLRTYGMSELGSQLATETEVGSGLKILSHAEIKTDNDQALVKSKCLFSFKVTTDFTTLDCVHRNEEWWMLPDRIEVLKDKSIRVLGRSGSIVKILGVKLDLMSFEQELREKLGFEVVLISRDHERKGKELILFSENDVDLNHLNEQLLGFQKISELQKIRFERTSLGKIKRGHLG